MAFLDTNSHLTTKPYNFDIKCQYNLESYDRYGFLAPSLGGFRLIYLRWKVFFSTRESTLGLTGWTSSYLSVKLEEPDKCLKLN